MIHSVGERRHGECRFGGRVSEYLSVKVLTVRDLLSGAYVFHLPWFQRAYAWHSSEVGRLLTNILDAMENGSSRYFLGKITLAKKPSDPHTGLVDGHQRVMTLTLLFAVLRDLEEDEQERARLHGFIANQTFHLLAQHSLARFIEQYVQAPGATRQAPENDLLGLSETQRNIIENRDYVRTELLSDNCDAKVRRAIAKFLADNCLILECALEEEDEAWRILQIEEDTRLEFSPTDRAKASLLSVVPAEERRLCQLCWEKSENLLGSADLHALLHHLRTLRLRSLSDKPVEADLPKVFSLNKEGASFFEKVLLPGAETIARIRAGRIGHARDQDVIGAAIRQMTWIDGNYWIPAVLNWLDKRDEADPDTAVFFRRLERLVWIMRIAGTDPVKRQRHILRLLGEVDKGGKADSLKELKIPKKMLDTALTNLRSPTFDAKHYAARLLRRVSVALGQDPGPTHPVRVTLEHILPKSCEPNSPWRKVFPDRKVVQNHAHRLGNLTFLRASDNQAADTSNWASKRKFLTSSEFLLSQRAGAARQWTPDSISQRTEELIGVLLKEWELK